MDAIRPTSGTILHTQIEEALRRLIRSGALPAGTVLPGELDLAAGLGLSRHTVRHALGALVTDGLVRRERGRGTRVLQAAETVMERRLDRFYAFAWEAHARGVAEKSIVLEFDAVAATRDIAEHLDLAPGAPVQRLVRVRTAADVPLVIETSYFPIDVAAKLELAALQRGSIYDEIERLHNMAVTRARETIRATTLSRSAAHVLGVRSGAPAFRVERTTWSGRRPIEWQSSLVRGDRFVYSAELGRPSRGRAARGGTRPLLS